MLEKLSAMGGMVVGVCLAMALNVFLFHHDWFMTILATVIAIGVAIAATFILLKEEE